MLSALHHYISLHLRSDLKGPLKILSATLLGPRQHFRDMLAAQPCFDATSSLQDFKASQREIVIVNIFYCIKLQNTKYQLQKKCVQYTLSLLPGVSTSVIASNCTHFTVTRKKSPPREKVCNQDVRWSLIGVHHQIICTRWDLKPVALLHCIGSRCSTSFVLPLALLHCIAAIQ